MAGILATTGILMKKFVFGVVAAVAMTGSAFAADMAPRYKGARSWLRSWSTIGPVATSAATSAVAGHGPRRTRSAHRSTSDRLSRIPPSAPATAAISSAAVRSAATTSSPATGWSASRACTTTRASTARTPDGLPDVPVEHPHQGHLDRNGPRRLPVHAATAGLRQGRWRLGSV